MVSAFFNIADSTAITVAAFEAMLNNTHDMVFVKNADLVYVAASDPFVKMVGKDSAEEIIGKNDHEIFADPNLASRYVSDDRRLLEDGRDLVEYVEPITDEDGHPRYGSTSKHILRDSSGRVIGIYGITRDITREYITRQHYQQELQYLFKLPADTFAVSYIDVDDWRLIGQRRQYIDEGSFQVVNTVEEMRTAAIASIIDSTCSAAEFYSNFTAERLRGIYDSGRTNITFTYQRRLTDNDIRWVRNEVRFLTDADSGHLCAMLTARDIDEKKREEQELVVAAQMDRMTMLFNRDTTMNRIERILEQEPDSIHALFMIDVDNFKQLNDTFGHQAGDEFIVQLAAELKNIFRESDIVGRVGGDEFFALLRNIPGLPIVIRKAEEILSSVRGLSTGCAAAEVSVSIGISLYPKNGETLSELYGQADGALYHAKRSGKNQYVLS